LNLGKEERPLLSNTRKIISVLRVSVQINYLDYPSHSDSFFLYKIPLKAKSFFMEKVCLHDIHSQRVGKKGIKIKSHRASFCVK